MKSDCYMTIFNLLLIPTSSLTTVIFLVLWFCPISVWISALRLSKIIAVDPAKTMPSETWLTFNQMEQTISKLLLKTEKIFNNWFLFPYDSETFVWNFPFKSNMATAFRLLGCSRELYSTVLSLIICQMASSICIESDRL